MRTETDESRLARSDEIGSRPANSFLERAAARATAWAGGNWAIAFAWGTVIAWLASGPLFRWSDTWQLVINTFTTLVTFLMVFLIQRSQNKESRAIQLKLNEIVAAIDGASNRLIGVEDLSESELETLTEHYRHLIEMARRDARLTESHSIDEANRRHERKRGRPEAGRARSI
jgi:low affinity Fe/Cu permease